MPGSVASCSAVAVLRSISSTAGALTGALTAALTAAFVGALTAGGAAWAGTASIPATTRSDSRASARSDRIIVLILLGHGWRKRAQHGPILPLQSACRIAFARKPIGYDGRSHVHELRRHRH